MKLALVGVGQAGGKIVDRFLEYEERVGGAFCRSTLAVNTADSDLVGLDRVSMDRRLLVGQDRVKGNGAGTDNELGAELVASAREELLNEVNSLPVHEVDAFLVVAALGGGTGSGGAPVVAQLLGRLFEEPVYGLGVLPATDEGGIYSLNAARSLKTFVRQVDNLMLFDNDNWRRSGESVHEGFRRMNGELVRRFGVILSAGELDGGGPVGETVVDASEVVNTLEAGGLSTVGYAAERVAPERRRGLFDRIGSWLSGPDEPAFDDASATNRLTSLVRKAALGRLTLPCDLDGTDRGLLVAAGPPEHLDRKGVERGRKWLEEETGCMEIRGGDYPIDGTEHVAVAVLLSGIETAPRLQELQQVARETKHAREGRAAEAPDRLAELVEGSDDGDSGIPSLER